MNKSGSDLRQLSTFQFGLVLLAGLTVFTLIVAGLSYYRNLGDREEKLETKTFEATPEPQERPVKAEREKRDVPVAVRKGRTSEEGRLIPTIELPTFEKKPVFTDGSGNWVSYDKDGRPRVNAMVNEDHPQAKNWRQRLKNTLMNMIRPTPQATKAAQLLLSTSDRYLTVLRQVEEMIHPEGYSFRIDYYPSLDELLIKTQANYLMSLEEMRDTQRNPSEGVVECVTRLPAVTALTHLPRLPVFDDKMREGENARGSSYIMAFGSPNPLQTLEAMREHIRASAECAGSVLDPATTRMQPVPTPMIAQQEAKPLPAGVQGALRPGEVPQEKEAGRPLSDGSPADEEKPVEKDQKIFPKFLNTTQTTLPPGVYGPLQPGEVPENEKPKPTPTPAK